MSKPCNNKVKNPCKICAQTVTNKNGLQCHGVCKRWAHYACLKYTPGKIQDIKEGLIKIICPCPDCASVEPDPNKPNDPNDKTKTLDKKAKSGIPDCPSLSKKKSPKPKTCCTSDTCKSLSNQQLETSDKENSPCVTPKQTKKNKTPSKPKKDPSLTNSCCGPDNHCVTKGSNTKQPKNKKDKQAKNKKEPCPELSPITSSSSCSLPPFSAQKSRSWSCLCGDSNHSPEKVKSSSDSNIPKNNGQLYAALEDMCKTVGELSTQLRDLMCQLIDSLQKKNNKLLV